MKTEHMIGLGAGAITIGLLAPRQAYTPIKRPASAPMTYKRITLSKRK